MVVANALGMHAARGQQQARSLQRIAGKDELARGKADRLAIEPIGVIDGIAFQTNILALTAALEAARTGEPARPTRLA